MNYINRAIKNVLRSKTKSILLILTFFLIGNLVIIGLGVSNASDSAKTLTRQKMRAVVTYELDYEAINEYVNGIEDSDEIDEFYSKNYPKISINDVSEMLKDERVKTANAVSANTVYQKDDAFTYVKLGNRAEEYMEEEDNNINDEYYYVNPKFAIRANYFDDMIEFADGEYSIASGRFYTKEEIANSSNVALITTELAELNNIGIGDKINITIVSESDLKQIKDGSITADDVNMELEVIGIYSHTAQITPDNTNFDYTYPYENPSNMILMPATTYNQYYLNYQRKMYEFYKDQYGEDYEFIEDNYVYIGNVTLLLNDPLDVEAFVEDYSNNVKQFTVLSANNDEFDKLSKPLDTLSLYANFIIWLVVINAVVVISLVTALTLKTREYEIGVLLSLGATKLKVIAQFFIELALVAIIGFTLSVASGSLIANKVGQTVLEYQIQSSDIEEDNMFNDDYINIWNDDYSTKLTIDDLVNEYDVSISPLLIIEIYVIGLSIVFVSVIIPSFMIMRYNPKKILMMQG